VDLSKLKEPFPPAAISWRVGSTTSDKKRGLAFAYIDARDVQDRLDAVCGVAGWQCSFPHANGKTVCSIGIKIGDEWIWKANGAGDTDVEAQKGALSDAFKRAAVMWGIGRYLYDVETPWVEIEPAGKSFKIKASEYPKLTKVLGGTKIPAPEPAPTQRKMTPEEWVSAAINEIGHFQRVADFDDWKRNNSAALGALNMRDEDQAQRLESILNAVEAQLAAEGKQ
jgi:hypothetical protein